MGAAKEDLKVKQAIKDAEAKRRGTFRKQCPSSPHHSVISSLDILSN